MATGRASLPLSLGLGGVAALFIISGIKNKSLGEVLKGDVGKLAGAPESAAEPNPGSGVVGEVNAAGTGAVAPSPQQLVPQNSAGTGAADAPNPFNAFKDVGQEQKRAQEVKYGVTVATAYREQLEREVSRGAINSKTAQQRFQQRYPWYNTWVQELQRFIAQGVYTK